MSRNRGPTRTTFLIAFSRTASKSPSTNCRCKAAHHGREINGDVLKIVRADGSAIEVLMFAKPIRDDQGAIQGAVGVCIDITAHRRAEEALREANRQKDRFLAVLAHELRNPLAPIRGAVQLLQLLGSAVPDKGLAIEVIDRQVDMLARLVDDLLDVSRISKGKITLRKEPLEISAAIQRAIDTALSSIHSRGQILSVTLPNEPLYVEGDATRIEQVFCNLLNNAAKFMDAGGRIEVACKREHGWAVIRIVDHGRGLRPETISRLFEPFFQADQGLARSEGGLGLRLDAGQAAGRTARRNNRSPQRRPGPGERVHDPTAGDRRPGAGRQRASEAANPSAATRPLRVLIVDDSQDATMTMKLLLEIRGHEAATAASGPEALKVFDEFQPHVVLLDIGLPEMDGYEVAKRLRAKIGRRRKDHRHDGLRPG